MTRAWLATTLEAADATDDAVLAVIVVPEGSAASAGAESSTTNAVISPDGALAWLA